MRVVRALLPFILTIVLIFLLDRPLGPLPALGRLLDPVNGWGANAEPRHKDFSITVSLPGLKDQVNIWLEDRLVPHLQAKNDHDLYFTQGYVHARFRLWQMDLQTRAAAGRVSEVVGEKALAFDRGQRRKGMVYGAEQSLKAMEADRRTREMMDAYTAGVNQYIAELRFRDLPLEYKLIGFRPEPWTNLKTALLLKYMADDLTGYTEDIALTILRDQLPADQFALLYPPRLQGSDPVIPSGTTFDAPSLASPVAPGDSVWTHFPVSPQKTTTAFRFPQGPDGIGSNSWVVSGAHTKSGAPILCNDPHLGLNLPSLWFEMQLQSGKMNCYGVSLPGAPGIVIGFNDSLAWGFTNNYRDVKDFYEIDVVDKDLYRFDGKPQPFTPRVETIGIRGKPDVRDTVNYTVHGPVMYDEHFPDPANTGRRLAMCWMAHRPTNELLSLYLLNRAGSYIEFTEAILHFQCPAQNMIYADRSGNIAMWGQGQFVNKWKDQGRYVMKGNTSATLWGELIPMTENPHVLNPEQGFLSSANQITTDSTYPYWYNGYFYDFRSWRINQLLRHYTTGQKADPLLFQRMQQDVYSVLAANVLPVMLRIYGPGGNPKLNALRSWDYNLHADNTAASLFQVWWALFYEQAWSHRIPQRILLPSPERTMQLLLQDSAGFRDALRASFDLATDSLSKLANDGNALVPWHQVKRTQLTHLAKLDAFSYKELRNGGWGNTINAVKGTHGPSWRMVVEMGRGGIRAYGVYPGGQSGNPGSRYYGSFVDQWVKGGYYEIYFVPRGQRPGSGKVRYSWTVKS